MKQSDLSEACSKSDAINQLREERLAWARVDLTTKKVPFLLAKWRNDFTTEPLPVITVDADMHSAIVQAIVNEYDERIDILEAELCDMGVKLGV